MLAVVALLQLERDRTAKLLGEDDGARLEDSPDVLVGDDLVLHVISHRRDDVFQLLVEDIVEQLHVQLCILVVLVAGQSLGELAPPVDEGLERSRKHQPLEIDGHARVSIQHLAKYLLEEGALYHDAIDLELLAGVVALLWSLC